MSPTCASSGHRPALRCPEPVPGGSLEQLRPFVNVADEDWKLLLGWLVAALNPAGPYPVLVLLGEQHGEVDHGRARAQRLRPRRRGTPRAAQDRARPHDLGLELLGAAARQPHQGDPRAVQRAVPARNGRRVRNPRALQRPGPGRVRPLPAGAHHRDRRSRPRRRSPRALDDLRAAADPAPGRAARRGTSGPDSRPSTPEILGALLDAASCALRRRDHVAMDASPRMADAASWMTAAEPALAAPTGYLARAFLDNQRDVSVRGSARTRWRAR